MFLRLCATSLPALSTTQSPILHFPPPCDGPPPNSAGRTVKTRVFRTLAGAWGRETHGHTYTRTHAHTRHRDGGAWNEMLRCISIQMHNG